MNNNQKEKGFSLVEVIIGMSLIAILFTILILEVNILDISRRQRYGDIAYHIANIQMESLRSTSFEELMESGTIVDDQLAQIPYGAGNYSVADYPGYEGVKKLP